MYSAWRPAISLWSTFAQAAGSSKSSTAYFMWTSSSVGFDCTTNGLLRFRHAVQHGQRARLVEPFVEVAALGALDAGGAAALARAPLEHADGVGDPALELVEATLRDPDTARVPVVDEDRRLARVLVEVRRQAADVPAVAHRPERQQRDHRVLGGVQRGEQRRHRLEAVELAGGRDVPDRLRVEGRRRQVELDGVDRGLVADALALVRDDLLGHRHPAEPEREAK